MQSREAVLSYLDGLSIPYSLLTHPPVWTIQDCADIPGFDGVEAVIPRNAFLMPASAARSTAFSEKVGPEYRASLEAHPALPYYLMLIRPDVPFRTAGISRALGVSRLSFAPEALLPHLLGLSKGAVSPLGLIFDKAKRVTLVLDEGLRAHEALGLHPCDNEATVRMRTDDFLSRFLPSLGITPRWVRADSPAE